MVLPVAMQSGIIQPNGIIAGKLKGAMPANTPSGSRYVTVSCPAETFIRLSPFIIIGAPTASSHASMILMTSPRASSRFLPSSRLTRRVTSSMCSSRSAFHLNSTWVRTAAGLSDHRTKAWWADSMAAVTSAAVQHGAWAKTSPVLESVTGVYTSVADARHSPSTQ